MDQRALRLRSSSGLALLVLAAVASAPAVASGRAPGSGMVRPVPSREARRAGPVSVSLGASGGDSHARELLTEALTAAVRQNPALVLQDSGRVGASLVVNARVRSLTVQHDAIGMMARCDLSVVVADGTGAVRALLDARRLVRGGDADQIERTALRGAADGVVRDLVAQMVR